jgi:hypothetical protein
MQLSGARVPAAIMPSPRRRYYVAEGVRLYAQETWRRVMRDGGRAAVARHIGPVVAHYTSQSRANNHAVREAGCACIAELMEKVGSQTATKTEAGFNKDATETL